MKIVFDNVVNGWRKFESKDDFERQYPKPVYGKYIPQPDFEPARYPCYYKEASFRACSDGADEYIMCYIYDFVEIDE